MRRFYSAASVALAGFFTVLPLPTARVAPAIDPQLYAGLTWRNLGPFRGGRISAVSGAIGQPGVFYAGLPAAGVWKTTSAGETWYPVFDAVKDVSSIGAIDVAPSNPNVIYVGTGDMVTGGAINEGNGVYTSTDAGSTWRHIGLDSTRQIPSMLVDPLDPNVVLVAAQGDLHVRSGARGVFRTTNGGATWTRTLFADDTTGAQKLARANDVPAVIFATTVKHFTAPFAPSRQPVRQAAADTGRTNTALYKSTDGGMTWRETSGGGLPRLNGRTSVAVAMHTNAQRVFLVSDNGLYRSDDGGTSWKQMAADDERIRNGQGGYNCGVYVDPQNPDVVYTISTSSYRSTDGGNTFTGFKGAPGGDDPQQLWIDPTNGSRMLLGLDQGAVVTLDAGATWSSWYNQNTEQIYHLSADNSFPYWIYGTQQDAGAIRTRSRGNLGAITSLDWNPVPGWEWGTIIADPRDPNTVYGSGSGILKISYPSEQGINVSPAADPAAKLRTTSSQPIAFAPWNPKMLIAAFQSLWSTTDGGAHWKQMSPDLTVRAGADTTMPGIRNTAIESFSPSSVASGTIWVGASSGVIKLTRDTGATWTDVSVAGLPMGPRVNVAVDASHFDAATAYAAIDYHYQGDYGVYVYRTHDYGRTWTKITTGLPVGQTGGSFVRAIRSDTKKKGLLFAGTESGMSVSFDDGDSWSSLQQNLPTTSYRDIAIKDNDLIVATYGRGLFVLDDMSMLRELAPAIAGEPAHLFKPGDAVRVHRNVSADTPFPPEVPHALNPPDGVVIDYWLAHKPSRDVTIDVLDAMGAVVRHLSSGQIAPVSEAARPPHPNFWVTAPEPLPANAGENRTHWDLRHDAPPAFSHSFEINANPGLTPSSPEGALVVPGTYTLKLTVDGKSLAHTVTVRSDPRSPATPAALREQHALQMGIMDGLKASYDGQRAAVALRASLRALPASTQPELADITTRASMLAAQLDTVVGLDASRGNRARAAAAPRPTFTAINNALVAQLNAQDLGDMAPTAPTIARYASTCKELASLVTAWQRLSTVDLGAVNTLLTKQGRTAITMDGAALRAPACRTP